MGAQKHKLPFKTAQALFLLVCLVLLSRVHLPIRCNQGFLQSTQTFKLRLTIALIKDAIRIDLKVKQQNVSWVSSVHRSEKKMHPKYSGVQNTLQSYPNISDLGRKYVQSINTVRKKWI